MQTTDADPNMILTALWNHISLIKTEEGETVFNNVFIGNRPTTSEAMNDFVVISTNGTVVDKAGHARCVCMVQLFARDIDAKGTLNMGKLSDMFEALTDALPYNSKPYTFTKKNQVGIRDSLGFHATLINLDCLIY